MISGSQHAFKSNLYITEYMCISFQPSPPMPHEKVGTSYYKTYPKRMLTTRYKSDLTRMIDLLL